MRRGSDEERGCKRWLANLALSFLDKTNGTVVSLTAGVLLYMRSAGVAYFVAGAVLCSISVKLIKRSIRQPRPPHTLQRKIKKSYGMPSTHSATISFFATYIFLASQYLPIHQTLPRNPAVIRIVAPLVALPWGVAIMMSRVWLGYHTWAQVGVGSAYGMGLAVGWFRLWTSGLHVVGRTVEDTVWRLFGWSR